MNSLKIALLQIAPCGTLKDNLTKGIEACKKAKEMGFDGIEFIDLSPSDGMSEKEYAYSAALAQGTEFLELASMPEFNDCYVDCLLFEEEE